MKWNDFQANVSKSFSCLRKEEDFCDVTLVSDDEKHIEAHKLVLSASSEFFKNILKKTPHSNPLIYLNGFSSTHLQLMMDYIYEGEVQIFQSDLDTFLAFAQKLKIEGLIGGYEDSKDNNYSIEGSEDENKMNLNINEDICLDTASNKIHKAPRIHNTHKNELARIASNNEEGMETVNEMITKSGDLWLCKKCGKTAKQSSSIRLHAETHIEGLSFNCCYCDKTFRSRNSMTCHVYTKHKSK